MEYPETTQQKINYFKVWEELVLSFEKLILVLKIMITPYLGAQKNWAVVLTTLYKYADSTKYIIESFKICQIFKSKFVETILF